MVAKVRIDFILALGPMPYYPCPYVRSFRPKIALSYTYIFLSLLFNIFKEKLRRKIIDTLYIGI